MEDDEIARLKDRIIHNYQAAYRVFSSPERLSSQAMITSKLTNMQQDALHLAYLIGEHETQQFLLDVMLRSQTIDTAQRLEPLFQPGALIQRTSDNTTLYRVTFIQYIEQTPYYHLVSSTGRYLILPHAQVQQWRKAIASAPSALPVYAGKERS